MWIELSQIMKRPQMWEERIEAVIEIETLRYRNNPTFWLAFAYMIQKGITYIARMIGFILSVNKQKWEWKVKYPQVEKSGTYAILRCWVLQQIQMEMIKNVLAPLQLDVLDRMPAFKSIEEKYSIKPSIAVVAGFFLLLLISPLLNTYALMTSFVCYLVPAYFSFLALESTEKDDDVRYLNYWILFSLSELCTPFLGLFFNNFFYMLLRMTITVLLLHPLSNLSLKVYNGFVRPFLLNHEKQIDSKINDIAKEGKKKVLEELSEGIKNLA